LDLSDTILDIVSPVIDELVAKDDEMEVDGDKETKVKDSVRDDLCAGGITASAKSFGPKSLASKDFPSNFLQFLETAQKANSMHSRAISIQLFESLEPLFKALGTAKLALLKNTTQVTKIAIMLKEMLYKPQYASYGADTKLKRAKVLTAIASLAEKELATQIMGDSIYEEIRNEPAESVKEELKRARIALSGN
jgi:hypothetical protein